MPTATLINLRRRRESVADDDILDMEAIDCLAIDRRRRAVPTFATQTPRTQSHYRRAADSFVSDQNGVATVWNGIDPVLRFSPNIGTYEEAGVLAPDSAMTLGGSGTGNILGTLEAYTRFIDRDGNLSSLSPVSNVFDANRVTSSVTGATNSSPIVVSGASVVTGQIIKITGIQGNTAANGTFVARSVSGGFELYTDSSLTVGVVGNGDYQSGGTIAQGYSSLNYDNVPIPLEDKVVRRQILRNKDGDLTVFYIDIDTNDLTSTSFTSLTDSDSLLDGVALEDVSGHTLVDKSLPPDYKKIAAFHGGRIFAAGNEPYSEGAAAVINGSVSVTGIGTEWGPLTFIGRFFQVLGDVTVYTISDCSSTGALTLSTPFTGTTNPYANYIIHDGDGENLTFYWSEPQQPEAWPLENSETLAADPGAGVITGLMSMDRWLYILRENRIYNFSFVDNPLLDGFAAKASKRGCVNNRCWVQVEGVAYMFDYVGFHAFSGNDDEEIGSPDVRDLFRQQSLKWKINWEAKRTFHCVYDPGESTIRWFVTMAGFERPYHAVCYQIRLHRWWIEEYAFPIGASVLGRLSGKPQVYLGTNGRRIMALGQSTLDGADPGSGTTRATVTSSGTDWITVSGATYASPIVGNPVVIARGRGKGQRRIVTAVSNGRITVSQPWTTLPDTSSVLQVGGIQWTWRSSWLRWIEAQTQSQRSLTVQFKPLTDDNEMFVRVYRDLSDTPMTWARDVDPAEQNGMGHRENDPVGDLSINALKANGYTWNQMNENRQQWSDGVRFIQLEVGGVQNSDMQVLYRLIVGGAQPG